MHRTGRRSRDCRYGRLAELADAEKRASAMAQELVKAEQRLGQQRLTAPVDGVVQQLAVHTVGGVVTPAKQLMVIEYLREPTKCSLSTAAPTSRMSSCRHTRKAAY